MAEMTFGRNLLISDLHHEIGVINEGRVVRKLLIRHSLFQKCVYEGKRRGGIQRRFSTNTRPVFTPSQVSSESLYHPAMQTILSNLFVKGPSVSFGGCVCAERKGDGGSQRMGDECILNKGTRVYKGAGVWEKP